MLGRGMSFANSPWRRVISDIFPKKVVGRSPACRHRRTEDFDAVVVADIAVPARRTHRKAARSRQAGSEDTMSSALGKCDHRPRRGLRGGNEVDRMRSWSFGLQLCHPLGAPRETRAKDTAAARDGGLLDRDGDDGGMNGDVVDEDDVAADRPDNKAANYH